MNSPHRLDKVVIVDDDNRIRDLLRRFLSQVDTLLWLEQTPPDRRPVRRTRKGG